MAPQGAFTGQLFKLVPNGAGYFYLQSHQLESQDMALEGNVVSAASTLGGAAFMAPLSNSDSQLWKLVPQAVGNQIATGDSSWTLFIGSENFRGPVAFFPPTTWSRISAKNLPAVGRGLDVRMGVMASGAMEFAQVPGLQADDSGSSYSRIPRLLFPTEIQNKKLVSLLMQDVTAYSRQAIFAAVMSWFAGRPVASGAFAAAGAKANHFQSAQPISFDQGDDKQILSGISDIVRVADLSSANTCAWGLVWNEPPKGSGLARGHLPEYFKDGAAIAPSSVPDATGLSSAHFGKPPAGQTYDSPRSGAWRSPGQRGNSLTARLADGTRVTYAWCKFIDQPSLQNLTLTPAQKAQLQSRIELLHKNWPIDGTYIAAPSTGDLVSVDPALIVSPRSGLEVGYVPIVIKQEK